MLSKLEFRFYHNLKFMSYQFPIQCFTYFQKTGSPSHVSVVKNLLNKKKCNPPDIKFYIGTFSNKNFSPYGVMLFLGLSS